MIRIDKTKIVAVTEHIIERINIQEALGLTGWGIYVNIC